MDLCECGETAVDLEEAYSHLVGEPEILFRVPAFSVAYDLEVDDGTYAKKGDVFGSCTDEFDDINEAKACAKKHAPAIIKQTIWVEVKQDGEARWVKHDD